jgi:hypothetical protein
MPMEHMTQYKYTPKSAGFAALRLYRMIVVLEEFR